MCYHIRVARWLITIQEFDTELQHIKGVENHLADILSRYPAGLEVIEIQNLTKPNTISVNKIELKTDQAVIKNLKNLADKQKNDPKTKLRGLSARANYTDRAAAAGRRS